MEKIVAKRGKDQIYLVVKDPTNPQTKGYTANFEVNKRGRPIRAASIIMRGYWEDFQHDENLLKKIKTLPRWRRRK